MGYPLLKWMPDIIMYMNELYKKIEQLCSLIKKIKSPIAETPSIPEIKSIAPPSAKSSVPKTKIPGIAPTSKKDPKKVAEQIKNAETLKQNNPVLKIEDNGQWSLD